MTQHVRQLDQPPRWWSNLITEAWRTRQPAVPPTHDPNLIERVAMAIATADGCQIILGIPWPWAERSEPARIRYRTMAVAALDAMHAPSW